jgi:hypothetical protein
MGGEGPAAPGSSLSGGIFSVGVVSG